MNEDLNKEIKNIIKRLEKIEAIIFSAPNEKLVSNNKKKTMVEIVKGVKINSQQKVLFIVGYYEKILGKNNVTENDIKVGWKEAKFDGSYANFALVRALKEGYINDYDKNKSYILTQTGESIFDSLFTI
jgi:hypothetical protein